MHVWIPTRLTGVEPFNSMFRLFLSHTSVLDSFFSWQEEKGKKTKELVISGKAEEGAVNIKALAFFGRSSLETQNCRIKTGNTHTELSSLGQMTPKDLWQYCHITILKA